MASSLPSLKHDLTAVQSAVSSLLGKVQCAPTVPSWRFPEKTAAAVDLELVFRDIQLSQSGDKETGDARMLLTELLVDRLLLLLQLSMQLCTRNSKSSSSSFSSSSSSFSSSSIPLTLSSAVRKFCKCLVNQNQSMDKACQQAMSLQSKVTSMERTIEQLQEECELYKGALQCNRPLTTSSETVASGRRERVNQQSYSASVLTAVKNNEQGIVVDIGGSHLHHHSSDSISPSTLVQALPRATQNVSVQTLETALALCLKCTDYQQALVQLGKQVGKLCSQLQQPSQTLASDWRAVVETGRLGARKLVESIEEDLEGVGRSYTKLENRCNALQAKLVTQDSGLGELRARWSELCSHVEALEQELVETKRNCETSIYRAEDRHRRELETVREALRKEERVAEDLREEVYEMKQSKTRLEAHQIKKEHERQLLERSLSEAKGLETQLRGAQAELQQQLSILKQDQKSTQKLLEQRSVQLNKADVLSHTLEKRCKYLQAKQASLLLHVDELDQKCGQLQQELHCALQDKDQLSRNLTEVEENCQQLQQCIETQKAELAEAHKEHEELSSYSSNLENQLKHSQSQLEEEREKCHMLVDSPMIKPSTHDTFSSYVTSLSSKESQQQVTANTVRILTLEEQNNQLRRRMIGEAGSMERCSSELNPAWVQQPIRLWQDTAWMRKEDWERELTTEETRGDMHFTRRQSSSSGKTLRKNSGTPSTVGTRSRDQRASSTIMKTARGRLGHLVAALTDARLQTASTPAPPPSPSQTQAWASSPSSPLSDRDNSYSSIAVSMCSSCDRMFCSQHELTAHKQNCTA